jgi:hypothetical protein
MCLADNTGDVHKHKSWIVKVWHIDTMEVKWEFHGGTCLCNFLTFTSMFYGWHSNRIILEWEEVRSKQGKGMYNGKMLDVNIWPFPYPAKP